MEMMGWTRRFLTNRGEIKMYMPIAFCGRWRLKMENIIVFDECIHLFYGIWFWWFGTGGSTIPLGWVKTFQNHVNTTAGWDEYWGFLIGSRFDLGGCRYLFGPPLLLVPSAHGWISVPVGHNKKGLSIASRSCRCAHPQFWLVIRHPQKTFSLTIALGSLLDGFDFAIAWILVPKGIIVAPQQRFTIRYAGMPLKMVMDHVKWPANGWMILWVCHIIVTNWQYL